MTRVTVNIILERTSTIKIISVSLQTIALVLKDIKILCLHVVLIHTKLITSVL